MVLEQRPFDPIFVSARDRLGLDALVDRIGHALRFIRVYVKPPGLPPDKDEPVILREGDTIQSLLGRLPTDLDRGFRTALVWGKSARFPGQTVGREHVLADEDIVTIIIARGAARAAV